MLFVFVLGVFVYKKGGYLNKLLILYMGISVLVGSFIGLMLLNLFLEGMINFIYGVMVIIVVGLMFMFKKNNLVVDLFEVMFLKFLVVVLVFLVGICGGIVGVGGVFLFVFIMIIVLKIFVCVMIVSLLVVMFILFMGIIFGKVMMY